MWKTILTSMTILLVSLAAPASQAGDTAGRFSLTPLGEAFLRLDSATGAMSMCGAKEGSFVCEAVADDALALKHEIDRLSEENEAMRLKLLALEAALGDKAEKTEKTEKDAPAPEPAIKVPELDLDKVAELASRILKRFEDMLRAIKQEEAGERALASRK
ncbi:MAG: hypothetical protein MUO41_10745 [Methyloceanibacter sp.]|nr:hypothetical protein [Methyloceanibacter sp.]